MRLYAYLKGCMTSDNVDLRKMIVGIEEKLRLIVSVLDSRISLCTLVSLLKNYLGRIVKDSK